MRCSATSTCRSAATPMRFDHYDDAIARDDEFFYYHLQKGLAHRQLRQWEESRAALETSVQLAADGRRGLRARHAGRAARRSPSGARVLRAGRVARTAPPAKRRRTRRCGSTCPNNPGKYIQARGGLDNAGQLVVEVANPTRVTVTDVRRGRALRRLARRDPRARAAHRRAAAGASHALRDGARAVHVDAAVSRSVWRRARVARND